MRLLGNNQSSVVSIVTKKKKNYRHFSSAVRTYDRNKLAVLNFQIISLRPLDFKRKKTSEFAKISIKKNQCLCGRYSVYSA